MGFETYSSGFDLLGFTISFILIAVFISAALLIGLQIYNRSGKRSTRTYTPPQPVPVAPPVKAPVINDAPTDDGEIVAAIAAAITAFSGTDNFKIKSIRNDRPAAVSNWVLSGRLEAFQSRKVIRK